MSSFSDRWPFGLPTRLRALPPLGLPVAVLASVACSGATAPSASGRPRHDAPTLPVVAPLVFACVGDTRPPDEDDTAAYPNGVITQIFASIETSEPRPEFVVATGDYMFASNRPEGQAGAQLELYLEARAQYRGPFFPALGNHECTGATSSNCGEEGVDGVTADYAAFLEKLLAPSFTPPGPSAPYYEVRIVAPGEAWDAKLVVIAANAWSTQQAAWLDATLAEPTTYTFVVRHEPAQATTAPGVTPSEAILARHAYTLILVGHSHTYRHSTDRPREVLVGNGGAPLDSKDYGFAVFAQRPDGAIAVDMINWRTGEADAEFHFAVESDGGAAR
jgi:hypothetical protein